MTRHPPSSTLFPYTPLSRSPPGPAAGAAGPRSNAAGGTRPGPGPAHHDLFGVRQERSEEHTSELQSQSNLVCRLLLEKKKEIALPSPSTRCRNTRTRHVTQL